MTFTPTDAELDTKRRLARRRMAWWSFYCIIGYGLTMLGGVFFAGPAFPPALAAASPIINTILGVHAVVILGYLGASAYEAKNR